MANTNCWEFKKCGRESNGVNAASMGVCPAASLDKADGYCNGKNGGRGCVYITGTFCGGNIQGTHKEKSKNCAECDFYKLLKKEHGADLSVIQFNNYMRAQ